jgi:hypothetical protein
LRAAITAVAATEHLRTKSNIVMKNDLFLFAVVFFGLVLMPTLGQTSEQIRERYGQPTEAFSISEHIWMTPEYTADGEVCSMRLYSKRISSTANYLSNKLDYWELKTVLDQLSPPETRGKLSPFSGFGRLGGGMLITTFSYGSVGFRFVTSVNMYFDPLEKHKPSKKKPKHAKAKPEPEHDKGSEDELIVPRDVEIATIAWPRRPCAEKP